MWGVVMVFATITPCLECIEAYSQGAWLCTVSKQLTKPYSLVGADIQDSFFPEVLPKHMKLVHHDFTKPWPAEFEARFNLVHCRSSLAACGAHSMREVVRGFVKCTKHGGWIQLVDIDLREHDDYGGFGIGSASNYF